MSSDNRTLEELRREIDRIDDDMHELLMQRTAVVEAIGHGKARIPGSEAGGNRFFRPGREAVILRRLVARHRGRFPVRAIVRIWREIITGQLRVQQDFSVAVYADAGQHGYWDLARDQYGGLPLMIACQAPGHVVRAVRDGTAAIGVLPLPEDQDSEPWWPQLVATDENTPRIVSRLPFAGIGNGRELEALAIATLDVEETGHDRALMAVEVAEPVSHSALIRELAGAGFEARQVATWAPSEPDQDWCCLVETPGIVTADDSRLIAVIEQSKQALRRVLPIGGFAEPLDLGKLRDEAAE